MNRRRTIFILIFCVAVFLVWWFVKFPQPYGAYMQRGTYHKDPVMMSPKDQAIVPDAVLSGVLFGTDPALYSQRGDPRDDLHTSIPDGITEITVTEPRTPASIYDEYLAFFKGDRWTIEVQQPDGMMMILASKPSVSRIGVVILPGPDSSSYVTISHRP